MVWVMYASVGQSKKWGRPRGKPASRLAVPYREAGVARGATGLAGAGIGAAGAAAGERKHDGDGGGEEHHLDRVDGIVARRGAEAARHRDGRDEVAQGAAERHGEARGRGLHGPPGA